MNTAIPTSNIIFVNVFYLLVNVHIYRQVMLILLDHECALDLYVQCILNFKNYMYIVLKGGGHY